MDGEHRGIRWRGDVCSRDGWLDAEGGGWTVNAPAPGSRAEAEADAIRACDWLADMRDGIDLRAELAAVTAERDEARQERDAARDALASLHDDADRELGAAARVLLDCLRGGGE